RESPRSGWHGRRCRWPAGAEWHSTVLAAYRLVHPFEHEVAARLRADEHAFAAGLRHQFDGLLVAVITAIKRVPPERILLGDHQTKNLLVALLGNVEGVVEEGDHGDATRGQLVHVLFHQLDGQILVLASALREAAERAVERARFGGADGDEAAQRLGRKQVVIHHVVVERVRFRDQPVDHKAAIAAVAEIGHIAERATSPERRQQRGKRRFTLPTDDVVVGAQIFHQLQQRLAVEELGLIMDVWTADDDADSRIDAPHETNDLEDRMRRYVYGRGDGNGPHVSLTELGPQALPLEVKQIEEIGDEAVSRQRSV